MFAGGLCSANLTLDLAAIRLVQTVRADGLSELDDSEPALRPSFLAPGHARPEVPGETLPDLRPTTHVATDPECESFARLLTHITQHPSALQSFLTESKGWGDSCPPDRARTLRLSPSFCKPPARWAFRQLAAVDPACLELLRSGRARGVNAAVDRLRTYGARTELALATHLSCAAELPGAEAIALGQLAQADAPDDACVDLLFRRSGPLAERAQARYLAGVMLDPAAPERSAPVDSGAPPGEPADEDTLEVLRRGRDPTQAPWVYLPLKLLRPAQRDALGPLLQRMNGTRAPGRDSLWQALCASPGPSVKLRAACAEEGPSREPMWRILSGQSTELASVRDEYLDELAPQLATFLRAHPESYVRLFDTLCTRRQPQTQQMRTACAAVPSNQSLYQSSSDAGRATQQSLTDARGRWRRTLLVAVASMPGLAVFLFGLLLVRRDDLRLGLIVLFALAAWLATLALPQTPGVGELLALLVGMGVLSLVQPLRLIFGVAMAAAYALMLAAAIIANG